jgi:hypothetical protein
MDHEEQVSQAGTPAPPAAARASVVEKLEGLGVRGILWKLARDGQIIDVRCEMPQCYCPRGRRHFDSISPGADRTEEEAATYKTSIWQLRVIEGCVVDYSTFERAEAAGFSAEALVDDDYEPCQTEAQRLVSLGAGGVLSPSAALPGSMNLTLFGQRVPVAWDADVSIAATIPAQRLVTGQPPAGLVKRVRFYDEPHPLLGAFLAGGAKRRPGR